MPFRLIGETKNYIILGSNLEPLKSSPSKCITKPCKRPYPYITILEYIPAENIFEKVHTKKFLFKNSNLDFFIFRNRLFFLFNILYEKFYLYKFQYNFLN